MATQARFRLDSQASADKRSLWTPCPTTWAGREKKGFTSRRTKYNPFRNLSTNQLLPGRRVKSSCDT
eukprot:c34101_g1_i1 orf=146-346(+)